MGVQTKTIETCRSKRPRYFSDQLLTADILTAGQEFQRRQQWQLQRSLLGSGVVHGLTVSAAGAKEDAGCLTVGPGLAIDRWGRLLEVAKEGLRICLEDVVCPGDRLPESGVYTLLVHYAERPWPVLRDPCCPSHDQESCWICSGVRFSLVKGCADHDPCACPSVDCCLDACGYVCRRQGSSAGGVEPDRDLACALDCPPPLCDRCDGWHWDPKAGVPLACVEICEPPGAEPCEGGKWVLRPAAHDPCQVRRHVYRNRQLFELIRECHLERPRLEPPCWLEDWDGVGLPELSWAEFAQQCQDPEGGFPLWFTRHLRTDGIHEASIILTAVTKETRTDYREARRVPLASIVPLEVIEHAGAEFARGVRLKPTEDWLGAEIDDEEFDAVLRPRDRARPARRHAARPLRHDARCPPARRSRRPRARPQRRRPRDRLSCRAQAPGGQRRLSRRCEMTTTTKLAHAVRPMALERVHFFDGMILTADDLEAERRYHLTRSQIINRAVFGCGIACGLEVEKHPAKDQASCFVCIRPGVAFDCCGDPLELCRAVKLDLDPDPCKEPPERVCILIRRRDGKPQAGEACGCGKPAGDGPRRLREEVEIRVADSKTIGWDDVCRTPPKKTPSQDAGDCGDPEPEPQPEPDPCACLKECESCADCCDGWILLACVDLLTADGAECCPSPDRDRCRIDAIDDSGRKYIKPIRCHCPPKQPPGETKEPDPKPGDDPYPPDDRPTPPADEPRGDDRYGDDRPGRRRGQGRGRTRPKEG